MTSKIEALLRVGNFRLSQPGLPGHFWVITIITINENSKIVYSPNSDYVGIEEFSYTVADGNGGTDTASVTITIQGGVKSIYTSNGFVQDGSTFEDVIHYSGTDASWFKLWDASDRDYYTEGAEETDGNWVTAESLSQMDLPHNQNKFWIQSWGADSGLSEWKDFTATVGQDRSTVEVSDDTVVASSTVTYDQVIDISNFDSNGYLRVWNADESKYLDESGDKWIKASELSNYSFNPGSNGQETKIWVDTWLPDSGRSGWEDLKVSAEEQTTNANLSLLSFTVDDVDAGETFSIDVNISETASVETENLSVNLEVPGGGIDKTLEPDPLQGDQTTVTFENLAIDNAGFETAEVTADADNANSVTTSASFDVLEPEPGYSFDIIEETPQREDGYVQPSYLDSSGYDTSYNNILNDLLSLSDAQAGLLEPNQPEQAYLHWDSFEYSGFDHDTFVLDDLDAGTEYRIEITPEDPSSFQSNKISCLYGPSGDTEGLIMNLTNGFYNGSLYSETFTAQKKRRSLSVCLIRMVCGGCEWPRTLRYRAS